MGDLANVLDGQWISYVNKTKIIGNIMVILKKKKWIKVYDGNVVYDLGDIHSRADTSTLLLLLLLLLLLYYSYS